MNMIIAHRGKYTEPRFKSKPYENTIEAFEYAKDRGANAFEIDLRQTKDNKIVVFHDNSVKGKELSDITYLELCAIQNYSVPTFEEVLVFAKDNKMKIDVEIKEEGFEERVVSYAEKYLKGNYFISSFKARVLNKVKKINPEIKVGLIIGKEDKNIISASFRRVGEIISVISAYINGYDYFVAHSLFAKYRLIFFPKSKTILWGVKAKEVKNYSNYFGLIVDF